MKWFKTLLPIALALFIGFLGASFLRFIHAPMPWLLGSILAIIIASRFSFLPLQPAKKLSAPARSILGLAVGSAFSPEILHYLSDFISSIVLVFPFVLVITIVGTLYYAKVLKFDLYSAYFSSVPGGLLEMVALAESYKLDMYRVVIAQSSRLLFIIFTLPFAIQHFFGVNLDGRGGITQPLLKTNFFELMMMLFVALAGWKVALRLKIPGGTLIGPMILGAIVYSLGFLHSRPPTEIINAIQLTLGTSIGFSFRGISAKEGLKVVVQTMGYFVLLMGVSSFFIWIVHIATDFNLLDIILAFAPGGQSEMNLIAIIVGANLPYVALHHVIRLFLVLGIAPILSRYIYILDKK